MRTGQVVWGWPHCVQDTEVTQLAIDRRLTLIAFEAMNHWAQDGRFGLHVFHKNNELAGYCSVLHALRIIGSTGDYGRRLRAAVIGFGATARGAVTALNAHGIDDVRVLTNREVAAVGSPIHSVEIVAAVAKDRAETSHGHTVYRSAFSDNTTYGTDTCYYLLPWPGTGYAARLRLRKLPPVGQPPVSWPEKCDAAKEYLGVIADKVTAGTALPAACGQSVAGERPLRTSATVGRDAPRLERRACPAEETVLRQGQQWHTAPMPDFREAPLLLTLLSRDRSTACDHRAHPYRTAAARADCGPHSAATATTPASCTR